MKKKVASLVLAEVKNENAIPRISQRQLGHTNAAYSIQYTRVTDQELADALDNL
jgi:hypothetical protein